LFILQIYTRRLLVTKLTMFPSTSSKKWKWSGVHLKLQIHDVLEILSGLTFDKKSLYLRSLSKQIIQKIKSKYTYINILTFYGLYLNSLSVQMQNGGKAW